MSQIDTTAGVKQGEAVAPAEVFLKIPPKKELLGRIMMDLVEAGYDISVESVYDETFFEPRLLYYEVTITGSINTTEEMEV